MNQIHAFNTAQTTTWSGGKTTELFIFPTDARYVERDFDFRISTATIEVETSDFTPLPDYKRLLAVLEGELEIMHEGKYSKKLLPFESDSFHGSWKTTSKGKVRDFNVIHSENYALDFSFVTTEAQNAISRYSDFLFLFILSESQTAEGIQLNQYDLIEVDTEIVLEKGASFFKIELNRKN